jgi:sugar phosphate isomerase/epimerase
MSERKGPKRGVSIYSYTRELNITMTLEDAMMDMYDMGATGIEILANGHIPGYPNPSDEWVEYWFGLCKKYNITPVEYGHWVDSRLYRGKTLDAKESLAQLEKDIKLAHRLGFTVLRTKLGVKDEVLNPVDNWREFIKAALPLAAENNVVMCPEIHIPTALKSKMIDDYVDFIQKNNTKNFGLNIDFSTFQTYFDPDSFTMPGLPADGGPCSFPDDIIPLLPYVYACHAKFIYMDDNFREAYIPYNQIIRVLKDNNWDGYMLSEFEDHKPRPGSDLPCYVADQLRRHHILMKRILGY